MEYYSALEKKEIVQCKTTQMSLGKVMLSEISQKQKDKYGMILLRGIKIVKSIGTKSRTVIARV